ncbi:unnamed protein product [Cyclocybe aegerita]|uniref:DUF4203 domain-containing protein n=1 Tax=Cyclocybe aegerita TaxID=1973307 RepID=A0A8S0XLC2_CYCAE|nr:unnamed protein product [Cyclocybe aegerita]
MASTDESRPLSQLTPLLPTSSYLLPYAVPLLLLSLLFTFTGTLFTLDRTRSFPTRNIGISYASLPGALDHPKKKRRFTWALEGGIGGLIGGFLFGVHLSTALALLIPATTSAASLSPKSFLAVWIITAAITILLAGRYRYAAYIFYGVSGGTLLAIALCVIIHPSLPSRIILTAIFLPLTTLAVIISAAIPRLSTSNYFHPLLRICTASTGAFGVVLAIALLMDPKQAGWANVWERLWLRDGEGWGGGKEQGLSAAWGVFFVLGMASDWALKRWIGECPDEKWDSYLANYAANLPNQADRAGSFRPLTSFWDRVFPPARPFEPRSAKEKEILFPDEADFNSTRKPAILTPTLPTSTPMMLRNVGASAAHGKLSKGKSDSSGADEERKLDPVPTTAELLKKPRKKHFGIGGWSHDKNCAGRKRKPVVFGDVSSDDSDGDDDADGLEAGLKKRSSDTSSPSSPALGAPKTKPPFLTKGQRAQPLSRSYSSEAPTLVDGRTDGAGMDTVRRKEKAKQGDGRLEDLNTLDYEKEIEAVKDKLRRGTGAPSGTKEEVEYSDWEEEDLATVDRHHRRGRGQEKEGEWSPGFLKRHQSQSQATSVGPHPTAVPVPATPSLIKAIDRVALAQREAYGPSRAASQARPQHTEGRSPTRARTPPRAEGGGHGKEHERSPRWEEFWREVRAKAQT